MFSLHTSRSRHPSPQNPNLSPSEPEPTKNPTQNRTQNEAMEPKLSSKKRKRRLASPSDPITGIFTRSRSQVFFHRNRSGRARPDPKPSHHHRPSFRKRFSKRPRISIEESFSGGDADIGVNSVKDLRARRVFSPTLTIANEKGESAGNDGEDGVKIEFDVEFGRDEEKISEDSEIGIEVKDEWFQATPPDDEVVVVRESEQKVDLIGENGSNVMIPRNDIDANQDDKKSHLNDKTRSGALGFRSQMKLFKNPSSFSYKRLLPFLMDLAKDDSNALEIHPCKKVEKSAEEKLVPCLSNFQDIQMNQTNKDSLLDGHQLGASDAPIMKSNETIPMGSSDADCSNLQFHGQPVDEFVIQKPFETSNAYGINESVLRTPFNSNGETASHVQLDMSDNSSKLEPAQDSTGSVQEKEPLVKSLCSPPITPEPLRGPSDLPKQVEDDDRRSKALEISAADVKPSGALCLRQGAIRVEDSPPLENLLCGMTKGILKRHPRGCRGICNCINCVSFRLHAERAFEFSRNQLQDAEDVAMGLMKEVSCLRSLLEKSVDGVWCHSLAEVGEVKEACRKASRAEELAKSHLRDMKLELHIHSRTTWLQRPRVKFSDVEPQEPVTLNYK